MIIQSVRFADLVAVIIFILRVAGLLFRIELKLLNSLGLIVIGVRGIASFFTPCGHGGLYLTL